MQLKSQAEKMSSFWQNQNKSGSENLELFPQIKENLYGHRKKLLFLAEELKAFTEKPAKSPDQIKVLDFGCGNCEAVTFPLAALGFSLTGIDNCAEVLEYAAEKNPYPNLKLLCGGGELDLTEKFEAVILADLLEHLENPAQLLKKLGELLNPGGILLLSVPNGFGPFEIEKFLGEKLALAKLLERILKFLSSLKWKLKKQSPPISPPPPPYNLESGHLQHFTLKQLKMLLAKNGFKIEKIKAGAFLGAALSDMLLGQNKGFLKWNIEIAEKLPLFMVSSWYLKAVRNAE